MYEIEKKLRASKEACDIYIDKMGDTQQELREQGRIEEHYDVAGELLVIYAERLLKASPVKDHTRFIEIAALQDLLAQLSVGYPDAAAQAQELRENLGALRMLRVAERHVKDEMRWQQRELRKWEEAAERTAVQLAEEREKTSRIRSYMDRAEELAEECEKMRRERKSFQHKLWEAGAAKREERRRKRAGEDSACPVVTPYEVGDGLHPQGVRRICSAPSSLTAAQPRQGVALPRNDEGEGIVGDMKRRFGAENVECYKEVEA